MNSSDNQLSTLQNRLTELQEMFISANSIDGKLNVILSNFQPIRSIVFEVAGNAYLDLEAQKAGIKQYAIDYFFAVKCRYFLTNLRNMAFELQKANILSTDLSKQNAFLVESNSFLQKSTSQLVSAIRNLDNHNIKQYKHQNNPWPILRMQMESLEIQVNDFASKQVLFPQLNTHFKTIEHGFIESVESVKDTLVFNIELAKKLLFEWQNVLQGESLNTLGTPRTHQEFSNLEDILDFLPNETTIAIRLLDNQLMVKPINFRLVTKEWIESEISPIYYEIVELAEESRDELRMIRSNMTAKEKQENYIHEEAYQFTPKEVELMLEGYIIKNEQNLQTVNSLSAPLVEQLNSNLSLAHLYSENQQFFANKGLKYKNAVRTSGNSFRKTVKRYYNKKLKPIIDEILLAGQHTIGKSYGEKLVEITQYRTSVPYNYYSSIFLTRGLSGESFWVHRPYFEDKVSDIYKKWKQGYRGSILVTGTRHCGKTIFMEMLAREYFERRIVRISPESKIELDGRILETSTNLAEALKFIEKGTSTNKYLFIIDDLELWQSPNEALGHSILALIKHLDKYSSRNFYLVALGKYAYEHFDRYYHLERSFQYVIDLSKTRPDILAEIIAKRHYSTHVALYDDEENEIKIESLKPLIREVYEIANGNIGDALVFWTYMNQPNAEGKVINKEMKNYKMPHFIKRESKVVLDFLLLHRRTNEYQLRKSLGPTFTEKYESVLNRLMNVGVIKRLPDGRLEINEYIVNEIEALLKQIKEEQQI